MTPEEFKAKTDEILSNHTDQAKVSTLLAELVEDYNNETTVKNTAQATAEKLTADNEKLRAANMTLFLRVGETKPEPDTTKGNSEDEKPKYEDLFDENGELK